MVTKNAINSDIPIEISKGGTNASSMTNTYGVNYFDGTRLETTTVGTAGQVLTSNGAGSAPTMQALSQNLELVETISFSSTTASVVFDDLPSNTHFVVIIDEVYSTSDDLLVMEVSDDNGSTWETSGYTSGATFWRYNSASLTNQNTTSYFRFGGTSGIGEGHNFCVNIHNINTTNASHLFAEGMLTRGGSYYVMVVGEGPANVNALRFRMTGGGTPTFSSGRFSLYKDLES